MTRIKICGITQVDNAIMVANAGADAIGLVFYQPSPRAVTIQKAKAICDALPPFVTKIGLFVNAKPLEVTQVLEQVALDALQFHGDEPADYCQQFNYPWIKALRIRPSDHIAKLVSHYQPAQGILLDSYMEGIQGGTGHTFDWRLIPQNLDKPIILAGGLTPLNVVEAINTCHPYAVDVSGGVEQSKGIKCSDKVKEFIKSVQNSYNG